MATPPTVRTFQAGEVETAAYLNSVGVATSFLLNPPRVSVYPSAAQSIPSGTATPILFDVEVYDTDNMHSTVSNTSRITINTPGTYEIRASVGVIGNATGVRLVSFYKNGGLLSTVTQGSMAGTASVVVGTTAPDLVLAAGDYIEVAMLQNSGIALNTLSTQVNTWLTARWVAAS